LKINYRHLEIQNGHHIFGFFSLAFRTAWDRFFNVYIFDFQRFKLELKIEVKLIRHLEIQDGHQIFVPSQ